MELLDPYQRPPDGIRHVYKTYQKMRLKDLNRAADILDPENHESEFQERNMTVTRELDPEQLSQVFVKFASTDSDNIKFLQQKVPVYEHKDMPGLHIIPNLLPPEIQLILLSRLLHRDLSCPTHLTNIHTHYKLAYPPSISSNSSSFFSLPLDSSDPIATPLDPTIHKPITANQLLTKKLRWTTLGGQYDWTAKRYPATPPPAFPPDIKALLEGIFQDTKAEAAIVNLYSPGDTLSVHRDVAEFCATGLISISLGCDAIFVIGTQGLGGTEKVITLRLRSGSAVYMSGESRFAWHGVPQIVPDTCPVYLKEWPARDREEEFEGWRGWMDGKRVNLNVRQMWVS